MSGRTVLAWLFAAAGVAVLCVGCPYRRGRPLQAPGRLPPAVQTLSSEDGCPVVVLQPPGSRTGLRWSGRPLADPRNVSLAPIHAGAATGGCTLRLSVDGQEVLLRSSEDGARITVALAELTRGAETRSLTGSTCGRTWRMTTSDYFALSQFLERLEAMTAVDALRDGSACEHLAEAGTPRDDDAGVDM